MIFAVIRHGQTDYNKKLLIQGLIDNPLNQTGEDQAHRLGKYLKDENESFDVLLSSPLLRAKKTAEIVGSYIDLKLADTSSDFLERDFGPFEGKKVVDVLKDITEHSYKTNGYEDNEQLLKRMSDALDKVYQTYKDQKVLVVAHAHVIKSFMILADFDKYDYIQTYVGNLSIVYFKLEKNQISVIKQIDL